MRTCVAYFMGLRFGENVKFGALRLFCIAGQRNVSRCKTQVQSIVFIINFTVLCFLLLLRIRAVKKPGLEILTIKSNYGRSFPSSYLYYPSGRSP